MLRGVDLEVAPGEVHALLGANGAGKTTLVNVLVGMVRPEAGTLVLDGRAVDWARWSPRAARARGIGTVPQHSALVPALTVAENWAFGETDRGLLYRPAALRRRLRALGERFGAPVAPDARVEDLSVGERQRAELLRALDRGARVLVLDEPTAALTPGEARSLFAMVRRLRDAGRAVVFITHKLDEIREVADRVTVLRDGRAVASAPVSEASPEALGRLVLGRVLAPLERAPAGGDGRVVLALRGLSTPVRGGGVPLRGLSLELRSGEILGLAGMDGNGQRELEEALAGLRRLEAGRVEVEGRPVAPDVRRLRRAGVAQLSGERERAGLVPGLTVAENLALKGSYDDRRLFRRGRVDRAAMRARARELCARFGIEPAEPDADVATLSGGNAQKVAVARELEREPRVLVAVNPTRGLDVGSARFVHRELLALRASGAGVLLVSTELDEVRALADRMQALVRGRLCTLPEGVEPARLGAILLGEEAA